ncbi:MAG: hypothetical protein ABFD69_13530 [Candidatus Sumerlaeia bacterium]
MLRHQFSSFAADWQEMACGVTLFGADLARRSVDCDRYPRHDAVTGPAAPAKVNMLSPQYGLSQ